MSRRSLRPQLNQIRSWVRQGRTDAWIAHQLGVTVQQIQAFKREHELEPEGDGEATGAYPEEVDLRAEDDALIAAELEAEQAEVEEDESEESEAEEGDEDDEGEDAPRPRARRRGRRGTRRRRPARSAFEATFDHGEEGYGLWLDPAVAEDPVYAEHWAGHRPVEVMIEENRIVVRRAGDEDDADEDDE